MRAHPWRRSNVGAVFGDLHDTLDRSALGIFCLLGCRGDREIFQIALRRDGVSGFLLHQFALIKVRRVYRRPRVCVFGQLGVLVKNTFDPSALAPQ